MKFSRSLITAYSFLLAFAVCDAIIAVIYALQEIGWDQFQTNLAWVTCGLTAAISAWTCVLLATANRPQSTHPLCRVKAHYISLLIFSMVSLVLAIMIFTRLPKNCNLASEDSAGIHCGFSAVVAIFSIATFLDSTIMATVIITLSSRYNIRNNIASLNKVDGSDGGREENIEM
ncbi:hypothetical protein QCA50_000429 [Cerrena zonata]|uniref:MARVEL domain-containing protein n=1 Tax=Cerrena zonata TaxID=2478898 RepID=A0AAW0GZX4_9APHY